MMHESKGLHIGKAPSLNLFTFLMFLKSFLQSSDYVEIDEEVLGGLG